MSVAALLCPESDVESVAEALDRVVAHSAELNGTSSDAEIHASDIMSRTKGWEGLPDTDAAIKVIEDVVDELCALPDSHFAIRGVNVVKHRAKRYPETWGPKRVGIQHVLEMCDKHVKAPASLMVIIDEMAKPDEHRELLKLYRITGTPGFRNTKLKSIIDNIYFMPSHYARGIQAADILAYVHRKKCTLTKEDDSRALEASTRLWGKVFDSRKLKGYGVWPS